MAEGQVIERLDVAKVSPFIVENHELAGFPLILLLLLNWVVCEELTHKISTVTWGEPLGLRQFGIGTTSIAWRARLSGEQKLTVLQEWQTWVRLEGNEFTVSETLWGLQQSYRDHAFRSDAVQDPILRKLFWPRVATDLFSPVSYNPSATRNRLGFIGSLPWSELYPRGTGGAADEIQIGVDTRINAAVTAWIFRALYASRCSTG